MKLRYKNIFINLLAFFIFIGGVYFFGNRILSEDIVKNERREAEEMVTAAKYAIDDYAEQISYTASDWAAWDDIYSFAQGKNPDFEENNFNDSSINRLKFNFVLTTDISGKIIFQTAFDYKTYRRLEASDEWIKIVENNELLSHSGIADKKSGVIVLPEGAMFFASNPILTSEAEGPIAGTLFFGRFFDGEVAGELSRRMRRPFFAERYDAKEMRSDFAAAKNALIGGQDVYINAPDEKMMSSYALVKDIKGSPALIIRTDKGRDIYAQSKSDFSFALIIMSIFALIFCFFIFLLTELFITKRVFGIISGVERITASGSSSDRIRIGGKDEVATLAVHINKMLDSVTKYQREANESTEQLQRRVRELERFKKFAVDREARMSELKRQITKAKRSKVN